MVGKKPEMHASIPSSLVRLLERGGRGKRGGAPGPLRSAPEGPQRRRRAAAHGYVSAIVAFRVRVSAMREKGGGEKHVVVGGLLMLDGGPGTREQRGGGHGSTASMAPVFPLAPQ